MALIALGVMTLAPSASSETPRDTTDAIVALQSEVLVLVELGAFPSPVPQKLIDVYNEWSSYTNGMDRVSLLTWLDDAERDGQIALSGLIDPSQLSADVQVALSPLPGSARQALESGQPMSVSGTVYEHALNDLEFRSGEPPVDAQANSAAPGGAAPAPVATAAPAAGSTGSTGSTGSVGSTGSGTKAGTGARPTTGSAAGLPGPGGATGAPVTAPATGSDSAGAPADDGSTAPTTTSSAASDAGDRDGETTTGRAATSSTEDAGSATPWLVLGVVAAAGAVAALWFARRRTRPGPTAGRPAGEVPAGSVAALLDAGRRFGSSVEADDVGRILIEEAVALTGATGAAYVRLDPVNGLAEVATATDPSPVDPAQLTRGVIRRVLDTGVGVRSTVLDPALVDASGVAGERSVLAVPLVRSGTIAGVVVATREAERPFSSDDLDVLGQIVPMAAAALVAAGLHDDVTELSLTDGLTALGNRRRLDRDLVSTLGAGAGSVGFVMVDIDHFKTFNDTHGHVAGDEALRTLADLLRSSVRQGDLVYRYGGEEFCVLLPDATPAEAAEVSERLRSAVEAHDFPGGETQPSGRVTISVGTTVADRTDPVAIKERADHALYEAKHRGRNQVVVAGDDPVEPPS